MSEEKDLEMLNNNQMKFNEEISELKKLLIELNRRRIVEIQDIKSVLEGLIKIDIEGIEGEKDEVPYIPIPLIEREMTKLLKQLDGEKDLMTTECSSHLKGDISTDIINSKPSEPLSKRFPIAFSITAEEHEKEIQEIYAEFLEDIRYTDLIDLKKKWQKRLNND